MSRMASSTSARRVRRQFTEEFKEGAVRLVLDDGKSVGAVARELDLTASALAAWVQQARAERTKGKSGLMKEEREELVRAPQRESHPRRGARHPKKSRGVLRQAEPVRFRFIAAESAHHTVTILCRCLEVSASGFYAWRTRPESTRAREDRRLKVLVHASFTGGRGYYGSPRVHDDLQRLARARQPEAVDPLDAGRRPPRARPQALQGHDDE